MKNKGFTLIELLVVIAIIGILTTIALISFSSAREKAKEAKLKSEISSFRSGAELNYTDASGSLYACGDTADSGPNPNLSNGFTMFSPGGLNPLNSQTVTFGQSLPSGHEFSTKSLVVSLAEETSFLWCVSNSNSWVLIGSAYLANDADFNGYCVDSSGYIGKVDNFSEVESIADIDHENIQTCNP